MGVEVLQKPHVCPDLLAGAHDQIDRRHAALTELTLDAVAALWGGVQSFDGRSRSLEQDAAYISNPRADPGASTDDGAMLDVRASVDRQMLYRRRVWAIVTLWHGMVSG